MEATPPTSEKFAETCRQEFAFLVHEHGFKEVAQQSAQYHNPFEVHFERSGWRLIVEGLSYGFCAALTIQDPHGTRAAFGHIVPIDFFKTHREGLGRGQIGDIRYCALALRGFGSKFLAGDTTLFEELLRRQEACIERNRREVESWPYQHATRDAAEAFTRRDYPEVVRLLSPYTDSLSEVERRKLDYARSH